MADGLHELLVIPRPIRQDELAALAPRAFHELEPASSPDGLALLGLKPELIYVAEQ